MRALTELKKECMKRVGFVYCFCCENNKPKQLTMHHLAYYPDSVVFDQFDNSDDGRLKYYSHLIDEIKKRASNFFVLCNRCHETVEMLLKMPVYDVSNYIIANQRYSPRYSEIERVWSESLKSRRAIQAGGLDSFFWQ